MKGNDMLRSLVAELAWEPRGAKGHVLSMALGKP